MINFLLETSEYIYFNGLKISDITFIGSKDGEYECNWEDFIYIADFEYDNGYGLAEIPLDLVILFVDGTRMMRYEYDGRENWSIIRPYNKQGVSKPIKCLYSKNGKSTVKELNSNS